MTRLLTALTLAALVAPLSAQAPSRTTDGDLKTLILRLDQGRDQFEGALDGQLKASVIRTATGEVDVDRFLDDFDNNLERLNDRLKDDYSASSEAEAVLRQGSAIDAFFRRQPAGTRGDSEWTRMSTDLKSLAAAYGTTFPLAEGATVRRLSRKELSTAANDTAKAADQFKKTLDDSLKRDTTVTKEARETIVRQADQLKKDAETLRSRINDDRPSTGEAERLLASARQMASFLTTRPVPTATSAWSGVTSRLQTLAGAYNTNWQ